MNYININKTNHRFSVYIYTQIKPNNMNILCFWRNKMGTKHHLNLSNITTLTLATGDNIISPTNKTSHDIPGISVEITHKEYSKNLDTDSYVINTAKPIWAYHCNFSHVTTVRGMLQLTELVAIRDSTVGC